MKRVKKLPSTGYWPFNRLAILFYGFEPRASLGFTLNSALSLPTTSPAYTLFFGGMLSNPHMQTA